MHDYLKSKKQLIRKILAKDLDIKIILFIFYKKSQHNIGILLIFTSHRLPF